MSAIAFFKVERFLVTSSRCQKDILFQSLLEKGDSVFCWKLLIGMERTLLRPMSMNGRIRTHEGSPYMYCQEEHCFCDDNLAQVAS